MSWVEVSTGLYQRPLGGTEAGMVAAIAAERPFAREFIKIHCFAEVTAKCDSTQIISAFRNAWKALRLLKSPDIATMFKDGYNQYQVPTAQELDHWLEQTFVVAPLDTPTADIVRQMQLRREFLPVCYLVPQSVDDVSFRGTIILFISHWRTEASGCYQMTGQLCGFASDIITGSSIKQALEDHKPGSEVSKLVPALEDIVMPNKESSPESKARIEAHFNNYYDHQPSVDLATQANLATPPSHVMLNRQTYTTAGTTSLVAGCKAHAVTVTAAVHAAYVASVYSIAEPSKQDRSFALMMPAQVRPRLPPDSPYRDQGCWSASQMLMLALPAGQDFVTRAQSLGKQYALAGQPDWWFEDARAVIEQMNLMPAKSDPSKSQEVSASPWFTSLGVLDRGIIAQHHGVISVDELWGWADPMGPGCVLTMWTFRGRLNIQITWNASFHNEKQIQTIQDSIYNVLKDELKVEIENPTITKEVY